MEIIGDRLVFRYKCLETGTNMYGFISILDPTQIIYWKQYCCFEKVVHLRQLGSIGYFYFGLIKDTVKFGMFYGADHDTELKEFEFGEIS